MLVFVFWLSVAAILWAHAGYPAWMSWRSRRAQAAGEVPVLPAPVAADAPAEAQARLPEVDCIVACFNEERHVEERVRNFLQQRYPAEKIHVHMGSDGSSDRTPALLRGLASDRVHAHIFDVNRGKASVLNDLVAAGSSPILVFSDANTMFEPDALARLVRHFDDPAVGGVCGELRLLDSQGNNQDSVYWRVEQMLKREEGRMGALLGANGAVYAIRRSLWQPIAPDTVCDDFCIAMNVAAAGHRLVYDESAVALEDTPDAITDEYRRRVRIGIGNYQAFFRHPEYLTRTSPATRLAYVSHKVLRWFTPHLALLALLTSVMLGFGGHAFYALLALVQALIYLAVALHHGMQPPPKLPKLANLLVFFVTLNAAFAVGFWRYITGRYSGSWRRTERAAS